MLVPTLVWLVMRKADDPKRPQPTASEEIRSEPWNALSETHKKRAEIENKYLRRLSREAHKK